MNQVAVCTHLLPQPSSTSSPPSIRPSAQTATTPGQSRPPGSWMRSRRRSRPAPTAPAARARRQKIARGCDWRGSTASKVRAAAQEHEHQKHNRRGLTGAPCSSGAPVAAHRALACSRPPGPHPAFHPYLPHSLPGHARHLGQCPQTGLHVFLRTGLYGPYVQRGRDDDPKFHRQALPRVRFPPCCMQSLPGCMLLRCGGARACVHCGLPAATASLRRVQLCCIVVCMGYSCINQPLPRSLYPLLPSERQHAAGQPGHGPCHAGTAQGPGAKPGHRCAVNSRTAGRSMLGGLPAAAHSF